MANMLKGDEFKNRYIIKGVLTTDSPFHLGNGSEVKRDGLYEEVPKSPEYPDGKKFVRITAVDTDWRNKPRIPGSSIRGSLRSYLLNVFKSISTKLANDQDYEALIKQITDQEDQIKHAKNEFSHLERLFGTPFAESKIEVQDALCDSNVTAKNLGDGKHAPFWHPTRLTYVETGVAIDPKTRTAIEKKLYQFEAVPPGVSFRLTITGQNLDPLELGMLIFSLEAFNSEIWPMTLGSMSGSGFGRFSFELTEVGVLEDGASLKEWVKQVIGSPKAGYAAIPILPKEKMDDLVKSFKKNLKGSKLLEGE